MKKNCPESYIENFKLFNEDDHLFTGFNSTINFWRISEIKRGAARRCSMGNPINVDDVIFTWSLSPDVVCVIQVDYLEKFIESIQEARTKDSPTALTRCDDLLFRNGRDRSLKDISSPSIEVRSSNLFVIHGSEESGYTNRQELKDLQEWFYKENIRTHITSSIL